MLIKYYNHLTCYDGEKQFSVVPTNLRGKRLYPDEYLIANILQTYLKGRFGDFSGNKNIVILTEPWIEIEKNARTDGSKNTSAINRLILVETFKWNADYKNKKDTLILVPFLYGYHHPGIVIDLKNRLAIYIDPYGESPEQRGYNEVIALKKTLEQNQISFKIVTTKQQKDVTSCGPILTASMMKFIEEFMGQDNIITEDSFRAAEEKAKFLATDRMFQMYVKNSVFDLQEEKSLGLVNKEIMLADTNLWKKFFAEQVIDETMTRQIVDLVEKQMAYIYDQESRSKRSDSKKIEFIYKLQSRIIELIFLKEEQLTERFKNLIELGLNVNGINDIEALGKLVQACEIYRSFQNLLSDQYFPKTRQVLGLGSSKPCFRSTTTEIISAVLAAVALTVAILVLSPGGIIAVPGWAFWMVTGAIAIGLAYLVGKFFNDCKNSRKQGIPSSSAGVVATEEKTLLLPATALTSIMAVLSDVTRPPAGAPASPLRPSASLSV